MPKKSTIFKPASITHIQNIMKATGLDNILLSCFPGFLIDLVLLLGNQEFRKKLVARKGNLMDKEMDSSMQRPDDKPPSDNAQASFLSQVLDREAIAKQMSRIKVKIIVLSGKGGVGKSTVAANLAVGLALTGKRVSLLDVDIHGPSIPKLLALEGVPVSVKNETILPVEHSENLTVMSIGFLLPRTDDAVIWRGPMKMGIIRQFLKDVQWGERDFLIIDSPPGTGDEPLSIAQLIEKPTGAIIVTTSQDLATTDVRKCITFCRSVNLPIIGVIENMSGLVCPHCGKEIELFGKGGGEAMAQDMGVAFLGRIPFDPQVVSSGDQGLPFIHRYSASGTAKAFQPIIAQIAALSA
jgi:ATP-binding protein involved in chromosome partitioning